MGSHANRVSAWIIVFILAILVVACDSSNPNPTDPVPTDKSPVEDSSDPIIYTPSVEIIGEEELVFDWTTDRCGEENAPDLPVRAFRDAEGLVQINLSAPTNFRMIGEDLDSLQVDCDPILSSDADPDPAKYNFKEWMGSTYTLDGQTVYAIVHNEFHGNNASWWYPQRDFSNTQGQSDWYYQSWNGSSYKDMQFDSQNNRWQQQGTQSYCQISQQWAHPDYGCEPSRTWVSPVTATITISGSAKDYDSSGGDGVIVYIFKGSEELWSATIKNGDPQEHTFYLEVPVQEGDAIHFRVNQRGSNNNDTTYFNPEINVGPPPCPSGILDHCYMISLTYAVSTDGGKTFTHPPAPTHLIATLPIRYEPDWGLFAIWQPSNIVKSPKDDYYYVMIQLDYRPASGPGGQQGSCVMRTKTLDDPTSWRAWDGEDFNMRFINPYLESDFDPAEHTCQIVSWDMINALNFNLTYNTYFDKFLAAGVGTVLGPEGPVTGFYFSLSDDLINWTPRKLIMEVELAQTTDGPFLAYPSLVDPDNTSLNFDTTSQSPYLYYSKFQSMSLTNVDLLRVRIKFNKDEIGETTEPIIIRLDEQEKTIPADTPVVLLYGWATKTTDQLSDFLETVEFEVLLDGEPLPNVKDHWGEFEPFGDDAVISYWLYSLDDLSPGPHLIETKINLPTPVTDGYDSDGDGTPNEYIGIVYQGIMELTIKE